MLRVTESFNAQRERGYQHIRTRLHGFLNPFAGLVKVICSIGQLNAEAGSAISRRYSFIQPAASTQRVRITAGKPINVFFKTTTKGMVVFEIQLVKKKVLFFRAFQI